MGFYIFGGGGGGAVATPHHAARIVQSGQSISSGAPQLVDASSKVVRWDIGDLYDSDAATDHLFTAPVDGTYLVTFELKWGLRSVDGRGGGEGLVNGGAKLGGPRISGPPVLAGSTNQHQVASMIIDLDANDTWSIRVFHDEGSNINLDFVEMAMTLLREDD